MKKLTSMALLLSLTSSVAFAVPHTSIAPLNYLKKHQFLTSGLYPQPELTALKKSFPKLVIYQQIKSHIQGYEGYESSLGTIYIGQNALLLSAKSVLLFNYQGLALDNDKNIKRLIEDNTGTSIVDENKEHGLRFYRTKTNATIIANENIIENPYVIIGAFANDKSLSLLGQHQNAQPKTQDSKMSFTQKVKKAITYIKSHYPDNLVQFNAQNPKGTLTVFTDYTCPHCRDLHEHLNELLQSGFNVQYILLPRAGMNTGVARNMQKALCAKDKVGAVEYLYAHQSLPDDLPLNANCKAKIVNNIGFARGFDVSATPTIVASNGYMESGFTSTYMLLDSLKLGKSS